ncbi:zinc finger BED domain-containing protein RICESLEEPER 2-like protein [Tanacetum coccineum]
MFPVLSRMAMDLISVQATSVASKSAFSTSGKVLSIRRTKLNRVLYKYLRCRGARNEATPLSDEEIALDAASQGTMASGSGGEEQDFDFDLTN